MKTTMKLVVMLALTLHGKAFGQEIANIERIDFESINLNHKRPILISTPAAYNENTLVDFDVIYVFDAQHRESFDLVHSSINFMKNRRPFIVVGITSPAYEEQEYYRNNDMLPFPNNVALEDYQVKTNPNAKNFLKFVFEELMPFVEKEYRTTTNRIAVGHSLSASLILSSLITHPEYFNAFIAISPNFAYDKNRLAREMKKMNGNTLNQSKFLYISHADEADYWKDWKQARELVYKHLRDKRNLNDKINAIIEEFPSIDHWDVYLPAFISGFEKYLLYSKEHPEETSKERYEITIKVKVPDENDEVYITGNQNALANWNPKEIKLNKISKFEREIKLEVQNPAQIQFTRGSWESKACVKNTYEWKDIRIVPSKKNSFEFEITHWSDRLED